MINNIKKHLIILLFILGLINSSCSQKRSEQEKTHKHTNHLINESSPYLLQHAHNPVNWYPWGEEALAKAKSEDKPIIISIGYAACHWCHVMEKESFENEEVAALMNEHFVCIKVDREERPDIDQVYIEAAQMMNGSAGWPLNAIALPNTKPFFAGTYFPKKDWINLLNRVVEAYKTKKELIVEDANNITLGIRERSIIESPKREASFDKTILEASFSAWKSRFDTQSGGYGAAPKFPLPQSLKTLLSYGTLAQKPAAIQQVILTLDKMAAGGIYDQIGGGFARYSTDRIWKAPHFEKMLYDNGQLISVYSAAYKITKNPRYKEVVYQTLAFAERELSDKQGGFYASLDADSEGEEGQFYVWEKAELDSILGKDVKVFNDYFSVTEQGNWEEKNILYQSETTETIAKKYKISVAELKEKIKIASQKLLKSRAKKIRPATDDKVLTAWNAIMLSGYCDAYRTFGEPKFLQRAEKLAHFIWSEAREKDNRLNRNFKNGKSSINGFLDDYAFTISAFIGLYQATFEEKWLYKANDLVRYSLENFYDKKSGYFFYTSKLDPSLIARKIDLTDNVIPSANSVMAKNLFYLGSYFYKKDYHQISKRMLSGVQQNIAGSGSFFSNWFELQLHFVYPFYEVAIMGKNARKSAAELEQQFLPNALLLGGKKEGNLTLLENKLVEKQTTIYVCVEGVCKIPVTEVSEALKQMK